MTNPIWLQRLSGLACAWALCTAWVQAQTLSASPPTTASASSPSEKSLIAGKSATTQLLTLMDADQNGKVSKKEFLDFMGAEFDRLDTDHSGELDVKELKSLRMSARHPGGGGK